MSLAARHGQVDAAQDLAVLDRDVQVLDYQGVSHQAGTPIDTSCLTGDSPSARTSRAIRSARVSVLRTVLIASDTWCHTPREVQPASRSHAPDWYPSEVHSTSAMGPSSQRTTSPTLT